ncbi:hypothetical protein [Mycolicibacterium hippocampi]|uniref:Phthiocerol/phthiodiolone dimycocerosyl transferase n=1 Tax=Mycolicibacterium hippocampi TaxID=659824 RepID=A0A850PIX6_9MYCO|nr:hypothetical protein [Mycolicibacterium hippocampi]NVN50162.1 hypothetical protein [Mycolicibacterium hippocampi]
MAAPRRRRQTDTVRVATLDVQHSNRRSAVIVGPVRLPAIEDLTRRFAALAAVGPMARVGLQPSTSSTRWRYAPESVHQAVTETVLPDGADPTTLLATLRQGPPGGIRVLTAGDYLAIDFSHGLGEIPLLHTIIDVLFGCADPADRSLWAPFHRPVSPLLVAGVRALGLGPHRLLPLWRQRRRDVDAAPATQAPDTVAIIASPATRIARISGAELAETRAQRDSALPGVSLFAIHTHALYEAFLDAGFDVAPTVTLPFDVRRYLPRGYDTLASFTAGLDFELDRQAGPGLLQAQMTAANSTARPVANLIAGTVKTRLALRSGRSAEWTVPDRPQLRILHSGIGTVPRSGQWPFTDPAEARLLVASDPTGPCGVTVTTSTVLGAVWLTAHFHDSLFDADRIGRALNSVAERTRSLIGASSHP